MKVKLTEPITVEGKQIEECVMELESIDSWDPIDKLHDKFLKKFIEFRTKNKSSDEEPKTEEEKAEAKAEAKKSMTTEGIYKIASMIWGKNPFWKEIKEILEQSSNLKKAVGKASNKDKKPLTMGFIESFLLETVTETLEA